MSDAPEPMQKPWLRYVSTRSCRIRIYRRQASDAATREALGQMLSDAAGKVRFYMATLEMESPLAALAYGDLRNQTRRRGALFRDWAWQQPPIDNDSAMALNPPFHHDNDDEERLCLACMRHDLRIFRRRHSRRHRSAGTAQKPPGVRDLAHLRRRRATSATLASQSSQPPQSAGLTHTVKVAACQSDLEWVASQLATTHSALGQVGCSTHQAAGYLNPGLAWCLRRS